MTKDFASPYRALLEGMPASLSVQWERQEIASPGGDYRLLRYLATDGIQLTARCILPKGKKNVPLVLAFHDFTRTVRGWHHLTRYLALGWGVVALQYRSPLVDLTAGVEQGPAGLLWRQYYADALSTARAALQLPEVNPHAVMVVGEGMGGALAACVAAVLPQHVTKCGILNPLPCGIRRVWEMNADAGFYQGIRAWFRGYDPAHDSREQFFSTMEELDCAGFAPLLACRLLLGTSMLNKTTPAAAQTLFFEQANCPKRQLRFPKHDHELINFYENELLKFMLEE